MRNPFKRLGQWPGRAPWATPFMGACGTAAIKQVSRKKHHAKSTPLSTSCSSGFYHPHRPQPSSMAGGLPESQPVHQLLRPSLELPCLRLAPSTWMSLRDDDCHRHGSAPELPHHFVFSFIVVIDIVSLVSHASSRPSSDDRYYRPLCVVLHSLFIRWVEPAL